MPRSNPYDFETPGRAVSGLTPAEEKLVAELRRAVDASPGSVVAILAGPALSIALGRLRLSVSCGGCSDPLAYEGIPVRTMPGLPVPFRLLLGSSHT